mmetsp:Transcript_133768/g.198916  ORF Transcript_133768/g.198916 Transcript_133768/m.198916 type:complete len:234 (+) Transcript_133768:250-951(+)
MRSTETAFLLLLGVGSAVAFVAPSPSLRFSNAESLKSAPSRLILTASGTHRSISLQQGALGLRSRADGHSKAVVLLSSEQDFDSALVEKKLVFVELYGSHCRKCFAVRGKFSNLAEQHAHPERVAFTQIACDKDTSIAKRVGVSKVPTFQVYLDGQKVDELVGAEAVPVVSRKIKDLVQQWVAVASSSPETTTTAAAQHIIDEYSAATEVAVAASAPLVADECGAEGCEIVWD